MISFACPSCKKNLTVKDEFAGKRGSCPHCKNAVVVPAAARIANATPPVANASGSPAQEAMTAAAAPGDTPSLPDVGSAKLNFLAPAQKPDELGRLGTYRVLKVLGSGGMGMVLLAEDPVLKRQVAIKVMRPELAADNTARTRFLREAQATATLDHHNIVHIFQVTEEKGVPFIVMPLLKGEPLDVRIKRDGKLPIVDAVVIGKQVAEGLAEAHKNGLIHRDIKPANIWLQFDPLSPASGPLTPNPSPLSTGERGENIPLSVSGERGEIRVKIVDFGLARAVAGEEVHLTKTGTILGTPAYMAPEQARSEQIDFRCDLFSLGAVLYRLVTGELPFKGHDTMSMLMSLATDTPQPVHSLNPEAPPALSDLIMQLLAKDPARRPASAKAVAGMLGELVGDKTAMMAMPTSLSSRSPGFLPRLRSWAWRRPVLACGIGGSVVVLLLLLMALPFMGSGKQKRPEENLVSREHKRPEEPAKEYTNSLGMKFILIHAGKFTMGSSQEEIDRCLKLVGDNDWERARIPTAGPEHEVEITQPFFMGETEVTVGQFRRFVEETKYQVGDERWQKPGWEQTDNHPAVNITWNNAVDFCTWLSQREGKKYRLPTEAEWEYCCRAGTKSRYSFEDNEDELLSYAWINQNSKGRAQAVRQLLPNPWGLYDMHGNVWEWCQDFYDGKYYQVSPKKDPPGPRAGGPRVIRGGSWNYAPVRCRSASREHQVFGNRLTNLGFRVVLEPPKEYTNSLDMKFTLIPAGKFTMGSSKAEIDHWLKLVGDKGWEKERLPTEGPEHEVEITQPFYIGQTEVTFGQFRRFVEETKYQVVDERWQKPGWEQTDNHPVVFITWQNAVDFCLWLSQKHPPFPPLGKGGKGGWKYRLPTEAEWEYCCRAGTKSRYSCGDNEVELLGYAWISQNAKGKAQAVRQLFPNPWGLYDMHGNVWEWCQDFYEGKYYQVSPKKDPPGPGAGGERVLRGGSLDIAPVLCRSAFRNHRPFPGHRHSNIGFRVVLVALPPAGVRP